jgi:hypothetical protein
MSDSRRESRRVPNLQRKRSPYGMVQRIEMYKQRKETTHNNPERVARCNEPVMSQNPPNFHPITMDKPRTACQKTTRIPLYSECTDAQSSSESNSFSNSAIQIRINLLDHN